MVKEYPIEITSRLKYITDERALKVAQFILEYTFKDSEEVYTNGTLLVPTFRVLDALSMMNQEKIEYCCQG